MFLYDLPIISVSYIFSTRCCGRRHRAHYVWAGVRGEGRLGARWASGGGRRAGACSRRDLVQNPTVLGRTRSYGFAITLLSLRDISPYKISKNQQGYEHRRDSPCGCPLSGAESFRHGYAVPPPFHKGGFTVRPYGLCAAVGEIQKHTACALLRLRRCVVCILLYAIGVFCAVRISEQSECFQIKNSKRHIRSKAKDTKITLSS